MQQSEYEKFLQLVAANANLYGKTLNAEAMKLYWEDLQNYDLDDIFVAFRKHRRDEKAGKFMPRPADLIWSLGKPKAQATQANKCSAHWRGYDCPQKLRDHAGWCNYHFRIKETVNLDNYNMLNDGVFIRIVSKYTIEKEKYIQDYIKKHPVMKKPNVAILKSLMPSSTPEYPVRSTKDLPDFSQLMTGD